MSTVDHEVKVYSAEAICSCGENHKGITGAANLRWAYQHARKYLGSSQVIDTRHQNPAGF